jgi:homeobox protein Nkx-2.1
VKDGKPCSGGNSNTSQQQQQQNQSQQQQQQQQGSQSSVGNVNGILTSTDGGQTHSPEATTLLSSYNSGHNTQMLQQPCNNLMSNSLAMAYRNQNNFMSNSHQQQCAAGYLPLQGRAW